MGITPYITKQDSFYSPDIYTWVMVSYQCATATEHAPPIQAL